MKPATVALAFGAVVNGLSVRNGCQFHATAGGNVVGSVGEIPSGQVRAGNGIQSTTFTLNGDKLTDNKGRGCWWTPPTKVLQCDQGRIPDSGFSIGCDGTISYNGQTKFYECATGEAGQYNVYLEPKQGANCGEVTLKSNSCHANCQPTHPASNNCPANLNGPYEYPHLIVPVDKSKPNTAAGTSYFGEVNDHISSIFDFDIPGGDAGKKCSLVFLFPRQGDLSTSSFTIEGDGRLDFAKLNGAATTATTYNNRPGVEADLGQVTVVPGNSYNIATFNCPAGQRISFEISAVGSTKLRYFQDYNPSPIGLYITKC